MVLPETSPAAVTAEPLMLCAVTLVAESVPFRQVTEPIPKGEEMFM
jgi:hypothetical protein